MAVYKASMSEDDYIQFFKKNYGKDYDLPDSFTKEEAVDIIVKQQYMKLNQKHNIIDAPTVRPICNFLIDPPFKITAKWSIQKSYNRVQQINCALDIIKDTINKYTHFHVTYPFANLLKYEFGEVITTIGYEWRNKNGLFPDNASVIKLFFDEPLHVFLKVSSFSVYNNINKLTSEIHATEFNNNYLLVIIDPDVNETRIYYSYDMNDTRPEMIKIPYTAIHKNRYTQKTLRFREEIIDYLKTSIKNGMYFDDFQEVYDSITKDTGYSFSSIKRQVYHQNKKRAGEDRFYNVVLSDKNPVDKNILLSVVWYDMVPSEKLVDLMRFKHFHPNDVAFLINIHRYGKNARFTVIEPNETIFLEENIKIEH